MTSAGTLLVGSPAGSNSLSRGTERGQVWEHDVGFGLHCAALAETAILAPGQPAGTARELCGAGGVLYVSDADGVRGSWRPSGNTGGEERDFEDVPPSPALQAGRLLVGLYNGVSYSDGGGASWQASSLYQFGRYIAHEVHFHPVPGHPYGGVVLAIVDEPGIQPPGPSGALWASDDGGVTWVVRTRFDLAALAIEEVSRGRLFTAPDGVLWAGLTFGTGPGPHPCRVSRSFDGGATWARADGGFTPLPGSDYGFEVNDFKLGRDGRLYAATDYGVWRTTGPAVASAAPATADGPRLTVRPNPAGASVSVIVTVGEPGPAVVTVLDVTGREVARVHAGPIGAGETPLALDTSGWAAGVYVVRATVGGRTETARLVVTR